MVTHRPRPAMSGSPAVSDSELADVVLERLVRTYREGADSAQAERMAAYMKGIAPFLGIASPERKALSKSVLEGLARPDERDCAAIALRAWQLPEREYHYFAVDYLRRYVKCCSSGFLPVARHLITTVPWWDTVDALASHVVGGLVAADPALKKTMDDWIEDDDLWVARTALLHQLRYKDATDTGRLFAYCLRQSGHPDFFIRKAIGWCLREYAKTDARAVRDFVAAHERRLAPLSVREALKNTGVE